MADGNWGGARSGAGRKPKEAGRPRKAISLSLSQAAYEALAGYAGRTGKGLSEAADELLRAGAALAPFAGPEGEGPQVLERVVPRAEGAEADVEAGGTGA